MQKIIPKLNRSNIYRCLKRHGIQRLPKSPLIQKKISSKKFKDYPIGYFHVDITEVRTKEGKQQMYAAVDRTSKYVYASVYDRKTNQTAVEFLKELLEIVPYKIHTILTDNGRQFTIPVRSKKSSLSIFDKLCDKEGIRHKLTKPYHHEWLSREDEPHN